MFTKKPHKGATILYDEFSRQEISTVKRAFLLPITIIPYITNLYILKSKSP